MPTFQRVKGKQKASLKPEQDSAILTDEEPEAPQPPLTSGPDERFAGRRKKSWVSHDVDELTELRARQRTFDGAYVRTALGLLTYALVILKIFARDFAPIGILYVVMSVVVLLISLVRRARDYHDFADGNVVHTARFAALKGASTEGESSSLPPASQRVWGKRPFRTSGLTVLLLALATVGMEATLLGLVLKL